MIAFVNIPAVITRSCFPYIVILDCICEYTYCFNQELLPLFCEIMIAFVNIPTVITMSCFPYIVILDCICEFTYFYYHELLPFIVILDCIHEYTYCFNQELLPLFCDLMNVFVNIRTIFSPRVASLTL